MYRKHVLNEIIAEMYPCSENDFYDHVDEHEYYNILYGQTLWYMDRKDNVTAIKDGDNCFYIKLVN